MFLSEKIASSFSFFMTTVVFLDPKTVPLIIEYIVRGNEILHFPKELVNVIVEYSKQEPIFFDTVNSCP